KALLQGIVIIHDVFIVAVARDGIADTRFEACAVVETELMGDGGIAGIGYKLRLQTIGTLLPAKAVGFYLVAILAEPREAKDGEIARFAGRQVEMVTQVLKVGGRLIRKYAHFIQEV